ncbi:MAG: glycosyltransferase family 9 protein [Candidatus Sulfopaludibacter sp.]|nr:glycosyltransferase family 9 protein [Candidatus Sulfopaludibacter sp.]
MSIHSKDNARILVVRLGAMGDVLHALPAVASLKHSFRGARLSWLVKPQWAPLLEGNPFVDRLVLLRRDFPGGLYRTWRDLRAEGYDFAVDFQGLLQSAIWASAAHPERIFGFHSSQLRERAAGIFYSARTLADAAHVVDRNLQLAAAAGATSELHTFPLPPGSPEGQLPERDFVLASPLAGWRSKQWPLEHYAALATRLRSELGVPLVLNTPPGAAFSQVPDGMPHCSTLAGLIHATRRATAVVGVDSGPLHLAAALGKPGVAIFGPTDPARNGPYGGTLRVLRSPGAVTTYQRGSQIDESMRLVAPGDVFDALRTSLRCLV